MPKNFEVDGAAGVRGEYFRPGRLGKRVKRPVIRETFFVKVAASTFLCSDIEEHKCSPTEERARKEKTNDAPDMLRKDDLVVRMGPLCQAVPVPG